VGTNEGQADGFNVGLRDGSGVGLRVVGFGVGAFVGTLVGAAVGSLVGTTVGSLVGLPLGANVSRTSVTTSLKSVLCINSTAELLCMRRASAVEAASPDPSRRGDEEEGRPAEMNLTRISRNVVLSESASLRLYFSAASLIPSPRSRSIHSEVKTSLEATIRASVPFDAL